MYESKRMNLNKRFPIYPEKKKYKSLVNKRKSIIISIQDDTRKGITPFSCVE